MEDRNLVDIVDLFLVGCLSFLIVLQQGCNPLPLETTMDEVELQFLETDFGDGDNLSNPRCLALVMVDGNQKDGNNCRLRLLLFINLLKLKSLL